MKRCGRCHQWLELNAFSANRSRPDGRQTFCSPCRRAYAREHYLARRDYYIAKAKQRKEDARQSFRQYLSDWKTVPCADCKGIFPPWAMEFDHVRGEKLFNVSEAARWGRKRLVEEAAKCEIVCANCHRQRTRSRLLANLGSRQPGVMLFDTTKRRSGRSELGEDGRTLG